MSHDLSYDEMACELLGVEELPLSLPGRPTNDRDSIHYPGGLTYKDDFELLLQVCRYLAPSPYSDFSSNPWSSMDEVQRRPWLVLALEEKIKLELDKEEQMQTLRQLQPLVGEWSLKNFGGQATHHLEVTSDVGEGPPWVTVVYLNSMAPLMGIVEELGELFGSKTNAELEDAIGDIAIYLCDYCHRENIFVPTSTPPNTTGGLDPMSSLVVNVGQLYHCHLKRHQGIRGMDNVETFDKARMQAVGGIVYWLEAYTKEHVGSANFVTIVNETWHKVVARRDWKKDPETGQE